MRERGLADAVEFTGQVPIEQAWQQVARATVCVSPVRMPLLRVATTLIGLIHRPVGPAGMGWVAMRHHPLPS